MTIKETILQLTNKTQKSPKQVLVIAVSLALLLLISAGCTEDRVAIQSELIFAQIETAQNDILNATGEEIVVYSSDIAVLNQSLSSSNSQEDKVDTATKYIKNRSRVDCILDGIQTAIQEGTDISCSGVVTVESKERDGLKSVSTLSEAISDNNKNNGDSRKVLHDYLAIWSTVKKVDRVKESLEQIQRSRGIPLFGGIVESIHKFPILFEGNEMVPASDIDGLLSQFGNTPEDEQRTLVENYLRDANIID